MEWVEDVTWFRAKYRQLNNDEALPIFPCYSRNHTRTLEDDNTCSKGFDDGDKGLTNDCTLVPPKTFVGCRFRIDQVIETAQWFRLVSNSTVIYSLITGALIVALACRKHGL